MALSAVTGRDREAPGGGIWAESYVMEHVNLTEICWRAFYVEGPRRKGRGPEEHVLF